MGRSIVTVGIFHESSGKMLLKCPVDDNQQGFNHSARDFDWQEYMSTARPLEWDSQKTFAIWGLSTMGGTPSSHPFHVTGIFPFLRHPAIGDPPFVENGSQFLHLVAILVWT